MYNDTDRYLRLELESHIGHSLDIVTYVGAPRNVSLECNTCGCVIVDYEEPWS
jgi:hypothetical protein